MRALTLPLLALASLAALTACDGGTQGTDETVVPVDPATQSSVPTLEPTATATPAATEIPAPIRGRWGMVPADCEPGRDDAKGLLTITAEKLEFYESVGTLDAISESEPARIRASFGFEGEGMTWQREMVLDVQDEGATLIRREYGDGAAPGPIRYAKCN